jgi:hypothetical protein
VTEKNIHKMEVMCGKPNKRAQPNMKAKQSSKMAEQSDDNDNSDNENINMTIMSTLIAPIWQ